jgi:hypothetical protein
MIIPNKPIIIPALRVASLDRRMMRRDPIMLGFDNNEPPLRTPVLCNKYALEDSDEKGEAKRSPHSRSQSMPRQSRYGDRLVPPGPDNAPPGYDDNDMEMQPMRNKGRKMRERSGMFCSPLSAQRFLLKHKIYFSFFEFCSVFTQIFCRIQE